MADLPRGIRKSEVVTLTVRPERRSTLWGLSRAEIEEQLDVELTASNLKKRKIEVHISEIIRDDDGCESKNAHDVTGIFAKDPIPNNGDNIIKIKVFFRERAHASAAAVAFAMNSKRYGWLVSANDKLSYLLYSRLSYCAQNIPNEISELSEYRIEKEFQDTKIAPLDTVILWDAIQKKLPVSFINTGSICEKPVFKVRCLSPFLLSKNILLTVCMGCSNT